MKYFLYILTVILTTVSYGQGLEKGIYKGNQLPFTICYLTISDSVIEVEYFYKKGSQIFARIPAKPLELTYNSHSKAVFLKSADDSIQVFFKKNEIIIKKKGYKKIKVEKTTDTNAEINVLRNKQIHFQFSQNLHKELTEQNKMESQQFWNKWNSNYFEKYYYLDQADFKQKLEGYREEIMKN